MYIHNKYKPKTEDEYLFPVDAAGKILRKIIAMEKPLHLILHGLPGTGKTTFVDVLANKFEVDPVDIIQYRGSELTSSGDIQEKIFPALQCIPLNSPFKLLHIEEADHFNPRAITDMKSILENYPQVVCVMTSNNVKRIDAAILSRCVVAEIKQSKKNLTVMAERILSAECVEYDAIELDSMLSEFPCDIRSMINMLEIHYLN